MVCGFPPTPLSPHHFFSDSCLKYISCMFNPTLVSIFGGPELMHVTLIQESSGIIMLSGTLLTYGFLVIGDNEIPLLFFKKHFYHELSHAFGDVQKVKLYSVMNYH